MRLVWFGLVNHQHQTLLTGQKVHLRSTHHFVFRVLLMELVKFSNQMHAS